MAGLRGGRESVTRINVNNARIRQFPSARTDFFVGAGRTIVFARLMDGCHGSSFLFGELKRWNFDIPSH